MLRILKYLGIILTPTGVVATVCLAIGISSQISALVSILLMLVLSLYLFRNFVNLHFRPVFLIGLLLLIMSSWIWYYLRTHERIWIQKLYPESQQFLSDFDATVANCQNEMWVLATDLTLQLPSHRNVILEALKRGVSIRYLILDPYSPVIPLEETSFRMKPGDLTQECLTGFMSFMRLRDDWLGTKIADKSRVGSLEIRFYRVAPRSKLYYFDPGSDRGSLVLTPYVSGHGSMTMPALVFSNHDSALVAPYIAAFDQLWMVASTLNSFEAEHPQEGRAQ